MSLTVTIIAKLSGVEPRTALLAQHVVLGDVLVDGQRLREGARAEGARDDDRDPYGELRELCGVGLADSCTRVSRRGSREQCNTYRG